MRWLLALLALGCAPPPALCRDGSPLPEGGTCPALDDTADTAAIPAGPTTWTAAALASALSSGLDEALGAAPTLRAAYQRWLAQADDDCPSELPVGEDRITAWDNDCTADSGVRFLGNAIHVESTSAATLAAVPIDAALVCGQVPDPLPSTTDLFGVVELSGYRLSAADGATFNGGGLYTWTESTQGEDRARSAALCGTWRDTSDPGWLSAGGDLSLTVEADQIDGTTRLHADGAAQIGAQSFELIDLRFDPSTCGDQPSGALRARAEDGAWATLTFSAACDGCGRVTEAGVDLGEACVDLRALPATFLDRSLR